MGSSNSKKCDEKQCDELYTNNNDKILVKTLDHLDGNKPIYIMMKIGYGYKIYSIDAYNQFEIKLLGKLSKILKNYNGVELTFDNSELYGINGKLLNKGKNTITINDKETYKIEESKVGGKKKLIIKSKKLKIKKIKR